MISKVYSGGLNGMEAYLVQVEVDISTGLPGFAMVGSLSKEAKEARERVQVALKNTGYELPPMKIIVNLSPAHLRKDGTACDLPVAMGILSAMGILEEAMVEGVFFAGELSLNGELKPVSGILPMVHKAAQGGLTLCIVPKGNEREAAVIEGIEVRGAEHICQVISFLQNERREELLPAARVDIRALLKEREAEKLPDFSEVCGQEGAKRAAEIAAAGFHNLLMVGPPGAGKSMIAKRIPGILPPLTPEECMEVSAVYSVAGLLSPERPLVVKRPFQNPHHTASVTSLTGGSSIPRPGMISLAHRGILFLDEMPEFARVALDSLRQPMEDKQVLLARARGSVSYPSDFMLVGAMNPCACGYYPDWNRCTCTGMEVKRYQGRVSGPILDRMDLCVEILPVDLFALQGKTGESSRMIRERVMEARDRQRKRYQNTAYHFNADVEARDVERYCGLEDAERRLMKEVYEKLGLSARGYHRILRVARTIADLAGSGTIGEEQLLEAVCFRMYDRKEGLTQGEE